MILGTNGSGKSTLMRIGFTPIPPDPKDFHKGGRWEVDIFDKGHRYELKAVFEDKNFYSFIKEGKELNPGHTVTVQHALVREHFNYAPDLHAFLTGESKFLFTTMGPQLRRDWIAKFSQADFSYAFAQYNKFRKGWSKAQSVSEFLQKRINEETQRLMVEDDLAKMRDKLKELQQEVAELMRIPPSGASAYNEYELKEQLETTVQDIECFLNQEYPDVPKSGEDRFEEQLDKLGKRKAELTGRYHAIGENVAACEQKLRRIEALMDNDPEKLEMTRKELLKAIEQLPARSLDIPATLLSPQSRVIQELRYAIADLPDAYVTSDELIELNNVLTTMKGRLVKANALMDSIVQQIGHIERCAEVSCPACNTTFKPGVNPGELEALRGREKNGRALIQSSEKELTETQEKFDESNQVFKAYRELDRIKDKYRDEAYGLFSFIDHCGGMQLGRGLGEKLALYEKEVANNEMRVSLNTKLESIMAALDQYKQESGNYSSIRKEYDDAVAEYSKLQREREEITRQELDLKKRIEYGRRYDEMYHRRECDYETFVQRLKDFVNVQGDGLISEMIKKTQTTIGIMSNAIAENDLVESLIHDFEIQLEKSKVQEEAYKRLTEAMSPKNGIIAEQIARQIGAIVGAVNQMIKRVWGYPLQLQVGDLDGGDLDYKFPMIVDGIFRKDIVEGSDSMKEIVDRAFVMTSYYSLDLIDYPLFLDEPGRTFDAVHSQNLIPLIKDLVDGGRFSQIVIISHDQDCQTAFPNSETIILDDRNIQYPHPYNEHVEFA